MISLRHRRISWLLACFIVVGLAVVAFASARLYVGSEAAVQRTLVTRQVIADVLSLHKDAETGQRGFLLTGAAEFLTPYLEASNTVPGALSKLQNLSRQDAQQARTAREIATLSAAKLGELAETVQLAEEGRLADALLIVREGRGRRTMDAMRGAAALMLAREAALLQAGLAEAERQQHQTLVVLLLSFAVVLALFGVSLATVQRDMREAKRSNEQLRDSERAYRALADSASDLVRTFDSAGRGLYVSPSCNSLLGFSAEELLAMPLGALLHEDERDTVTSIIHQQKAARSAEASSLVHRLRTKNGTYRWFESYWSWSVRDGAAPDRLQITARDVHARVLAEDELRAQTVRLASVMASMSDGVVVLDEKRRFLVINPAAKSYIRQDVGEEAVAAWSAAHQVYLPDRSTLFPPEQGPLTRALRGESVDSVELVIRDRQDALRTFSVSAQPLIDDERIVGCVAVYRDMTAQRQAAKELQESEHRWRILSDASFEGVVITQTGIVVDCNLNLARWLGKQPQELVSAVGLNLFAPEDRDYVDEMSDHMTDAYEARMIRSNGTVFPVEVRGREAQFRGEPVRIAVIRDITIRKKQEEELSRRAALLRELALRDELTGLFNRRGFLEVATQALRLVTRTQRPACVLYADLNGLKAINDRLGHEPGDRALVATAHILRAVLRESDIVARIGGDEFAMLAIDCGQDDLASIRERLRASIDEFNTTTAEPFVLALSLGAAEHSHAAPLDLARLMELADARMYDNKRSAYESGPPQVVRVTSAGVSQGR